MALKSKETHNRSFQADIGSITNVVLLIAHLRLTTSASQRLEVKLNKNFISPLHIHAASKGSST